MCSRASYLLGKAKEMLGQCDVGVHQMQFLSAELLSVEDLISGSR